MSQPTTIAEVVAAAGQATIDAIAAARRPVVAEEPKAEEPKVEAPVDQPAAEDPKAEAPKTEEPVAEQPAEQPAATEQPAELPAEEKAMTFKAVAVDDQGVIVGIGASIADDRQDEAVNKAALIGMAYDFCARGERAFRYNHDQGSNVDAELVSSWPGAPVLKSGKILAPGEVIPDGDSVVAINIEKGKETHWFIGIKPNDPAVLDAVRNGEISGFSWGGYAKKVAQ